MGKSFSGSERRNNKYSLQKEERKFKEKQFFSQEAEPRKPKPPPKWRPYSEREVE